MKPSLLLILALLAAGAAHAQQAPNPLMRPVMNLGAPLPPPNGEGSYGKGPALPKEAGEAAPSRPRFDGWYVVFVTDQVAILRSPDPGPGGGDGNATKPGSPGFGNGTQDNGGAKGSPAAAAQTLEVENGEVFALADATLRAEIRRGLVTLTYLGSASSRRNDNPEIVFSGRVMSNPIAQTRTMERPDDRYISSVKPAPSSVRNVLSGTSTPAGGAPAGGMTGAPAAAGLGAATGGY